MSILKFKNPETGAWEKVGIPGTDITPEDIGAATVAQVQAAQSSADGAAQAAQNAQNSADSKVPNTRKINNKQLNADITLTAADVGAPTVVEMNTAVNGVASTVNSKEAAGTAAGLINRTTAVNAADTNYTTLMARGMSLNNADTTPAVNGAIAWTYE